MSKAVTQLKTPTVVTKTPAKVVPQHNMEPIVMDTRGLAKALFEEMDGVRSGKVSTARANAVSRLAADIIETKRLEMEVMKHRAKFILPEGESEVVSFTDEEKA